MIVSNNEKTSICVRFYIADKKLCEYEKLFGGKSKNRDKLIQSRTAGQHTKNCDCLSLLKKLWKHQLTKYSFKGNLL